MLHRYLNFIACFVMVTVIFAVGCSAQQTEEQALANLRQMASSGKLPPEGVVADIESRFAGKRTGALARFLRARIRFEANDFAGAATLLDSDVFRKKTKIADQALWLRGRSLQNAGDHTKAMSVLAQLIKDFPDSIRIRDAKLLWAASAIQSGNATEVPPFLIQLSEKDDADALLLTAKAYEAQSSQAEAVKYYRRTYFYAAGSAAAREAEAKLTALSQPLTPVDADELTSRTVRLMSTKSFPDAVSAFADLAARYPGAYSTKMAVRRIEAIAQTGKMADAQSVFAAIALTAKEREDAYRQLALGYAKAKIWPQLRLTVDAMKQNYPSGTLVAKTLIDAGLAARDARNRTDEGYYFNTAVAAFPNAIEVATAQFEAGWFQHESGNFAISSQMFINHLARFADKDTTNRGKAGYWAARDSERLGKLAEACSLYEGVSYRYSANWYGYLALGRLSSMKAQGNCRTTVAPNELIARAVANLKTVTVAGETAAAKAIALADKSDELSSVGIFDWAFDELQEAKKSAGNSPRINMALARHFRSKGDNTAAFLALRASYPDYAQMFPEEMGREEWSIFYPLVNWSEIKYWAGERGLDAFQIAGLIRQESVFTPNAKSPANAFGLMQLLVPTAQTMARKYVSKTAQVTATSLYQPQLNIQLGTAYMKEQFAKYGRIEYVAVAYNAGPGRVPQWRATLPADMDEFVEAIPFKETKGYVQGVIRNSAQYRRLYDDAGNFRSNVGSRPVRGEIDSRPRDQFNAEFSEIVIDDSAE